MDGAEFAEWMAYYQLEPFGEERADWRGAMVPYLLSCMFAKKGKKPKFQDFLLSTTSERKPSQTIEQMQASLKALAGMVDGNNR